MERANNRRRVCCERAMISNYSLYNLQRMAEDGARFKWMRGGAPSGIQAIDDMLLGSGGNGLHAAIGMCDRVNVYGAGLLSSGPLGDKMYTHAYDVSVGVCLKGPLSYGFSKGKGYDEYRQWLSSRIEAELVMHLLHSIGAITWRQ